VSFSGGEPLLRRDLFDIATHARNQGHEISLFTNGTLIQDAKTAHRLAEWFDWIQISLDGATPAVHDAFRGAGTFRRLMARLQQIYFETSVDHMAQCADCDLRYICGGGCRVRNLRERGDPHLPTCTEESRDAIYRRLLASDEA